jgi:hypothetical protein
MPQGPGFVPLTSNLGVSRCTLAFTKTTWYWRTVPKGNLGGVVISVLANGPTVCGFEPGHGDRLLRVIKFRSTLSFGWKVKPEVPCRKILRHVKDLLKSHGG